MEDIFDYIEETPQGSSEDIFSLSSGLPAPKDDSFFNIVKDYGKTALKGGIEGISKFGQMISPSLDIPLQPSLSLEQQSQNLDKILPTDEGFAQKTLRRGLKEAPTMLSFPGMAPAQTAIRTGAAAALGQTAEELGAPEWAQTAAELSAFIGPDIFKKLIASGSKKEIIEAARKLGLSDEAITPLIQGDFKQKWLSYISPRRGYTEKALKQSKGELSTAYRAIQKSEEASKQVSPEMRKNVLAAIEKQLLELPVETRNKILGDFKELKKGKLTGDSLINFYSDVNEVAGKSSRVFTVKGPVKEALKSISPELEKDFSLINDLYSKYYKISAKLKPTLTTDIIGASEALGALSAAMTGYYPYLVKIGGEKVARKVAQKMLLNPRYQQIPEKIMRAAKDNKYSVVRKGIEELKQLFGDDSPEIADQLDALTDEEIQSIFGD